MGVLYMRSINIVFILSFLIFLSMTPKEDLLNRLNKLNKVNLQKGHFVIAGSGGLAIRNLRFARDIDIVVDQYLWNKLSKTYPVSGPKNNLILIDDVEIWNDWHVLTKSIPKIINDSDMIDGWPFLNLRYNLICKKFLNRKKDLEDIKLIIKYFEDHNQLRLVQGKVCQR